MAKRKVKLDFQIEFDDATGQIINVFLPDGLTLANVIQPRADLKANEYTIISFAFGVPKPGVAITSGGPVDCNPGFCPRLIAGAWRCVPC